MEGKRNLSIQLIRIMWLLMIVDFIVEGILWHIFDVKYVFIYALNLQGILGTNYTGAALWFLTLLMLCYLLTPLLQWIKQKNIGRNVGIAVLVGSVLIQIILSYATDIGMVAGHTLSWCILAVGMYVAGYFVGNWILAEAISGHGKCVVENWSSSLYLQYAGAVMDSSIVTALDMQKGV